MKWSVFLLIVLCEYASSASELSLSKTIPLPNIEGRIDHLALDEAGGRLFVAALGNNTVEVVDLAAGRVARSLPGFSEPQGVLFIPENQRLYVANGGDGTVRVWDAAGLRELQVLKVGDDADNLRYDPEGQKIYVGYGDGALGIIDPNSSTLSGTIPLSGHPESFQLEKTSSRILINVPGAQQIAVVDRRSQRQVASWKLDGARANYPLALDEQAHRAFVGCRAPARMLVFDTETGRLGGTLKLHGDCDDLFCDESRHRVYASCGEGYIDIIDTQNVDHCFVRETLKTASKARTSLWAMNRLFLAIPRSQSREAHIDVYALRPE